MQTDDDPDDNAGEATDHDTGTNSEPFDPEWTAAGPGPEPATPPPRPDANAEPEPEPAPPPPGPGAGALPPPGQIWAPQGPRRLTRSRDRKLGGVAGGAAEYLGIDPTLVRLGFLLAVFIGGAGVIAYLVAWIVLPEDDGSRPAGTGQPPMRVRRNGPGMDTTTALAVGLFVFAALFGIAGPKGGEVLVPVAMIAGGIWLLSQREPSRDGDDGSVAFSRAGSAGTVTTALPVDDTARFPSRWDQPRPDQAWSGADADTEPTAAPEPPHQPRGPAVVTRITLSLLALLAAGAIAADELDLVDVTVPGVLAVALVVVGVGAIIAAFIGRGRGLVPLGLVLVVAFAGAAVVQSLVEDGTGKRSYVPTSVSEVLAEYRLGVGELDVDLTGIVIAAGTTVETTVDLGIGSAEVLVPEDVNVTVEGDVRFGELRIFDSEENGFRNELRRSRPARISEEGAASGAADVETLEEPGELIIRLEVGIGQGVVRNG